MVIKASLRAEKGGDGGTRPHQGTQRAARCLGAVYPAMVSVLLCSHCCVGIPLPGREEAKGHEIFGFNLSQFPAFFNHLFSSLF